MYVACVSILKVIILCSSSFVTQVELAVLADFLRERVVELENGEEAVESGAVGRVHATLEATEQRLRESEVRQRGLENEIAGLEAELADDRELIDLAAKKGGIGVAETIRRNKRIKAVLRERDSELEKTSDQYTVRIGVFKEDGYTIHTSISYVCALGAVGDKQKFTCGTATV